MTRSDAVKKGDYLVSVGRNSLSDGQQTSRVEQDAITSEAAETFGLPIPADGFYFDMLSRHEWPRPDFDAALARVESDPHCRGIVTWNQDRTFGNEHQQLDVYEALAEAGAVLVEGKPYRVIDPADAAQRLMGTINAWKSNEEVMRLRERVHGTHRQKVLRGKYVSRPVFGLRSLGPMKFTDKNRHDPGRIAENDRRTAERAARSMVEPDELRGWIIRDEPALTWVRTIWTWIAEGASAYSVCVRLRDAGVKSANGKSEWSTMSLRHLLDNPMFKGEMKWDQTQTRRPRNRATGAQTTKRVKRDRDEHLLVRSPFGVLLAAPHPGVDDYDHDRESCAACREGIKLWEEARRVIEARTTQSDVRRVHAPSIFDPFVRCGRCGKKMYHRKLGRPMRKDGTRLVAFEFRCATKRNTAQACVNWHSVHERYVIDAFTSIAERGNLPENVSVRLAEKASGADERIALKHRVTELTNERKNAVRLLAKDRITEEDFAGMEAEWNAELASIDARLDELRPAQSTRAETRLLAERCEAFALAWETLNDDRIPVERRQAVLAKLVSRIVIDAPNITIEWAAESPFRP